MSASEKKQPQKMPPPVSSTPDKSEPIGNLEAVVLRNEFYRDGYRTLLRLALIEAFVILGLIAAMMFIVHTHQPEDKYFATTEDGRVIPMVALNQPNLSTPALMSWVAQAATEVMTFGFHDYRRRFQEASRNFTKTGWSSFTVALEQSRILDQIQSQDQLVTAAPRGAPILLSEGENGRGRYQWIVQLPLTVTYDDGNNNRNEQQMITLIIVRVPRLESPNGVGIEQWLAS